jgi:adhesin transport system outer membrane protein
LAFQHWHCTLIVKIFLVRPGYWGIFATCGLIICGVFVRPAFAQDVTLTSLLQLAIYKHPTIIQARSQVKAAGYDLEAARWGRFPTVSSDLRSDERYVQSIARIEQPLWAGGRIDGRIELGQANLRVADASVKEAELNALQQVATSYFEVLRLMARLTAAKDSVREHTQLLGLISRRVEAQISPPADATLAQARLQQALTEQLQIQRQLDSARFSLAQWAGPISGHLKEPRRIDYERFPGHDFVLERAQKASGQRLKLQSQIESAVAQIQVSKAQGFPTVVAGHQYVIGGPLAPGLGRSSTYVGLQFQPGAGLSALSGVQSAVAKKEAAEMELEALDRSLEAQTKTLYNDIDALQAQLAPAQALQADTADLIDSYLRQYQIGRKNWLDVLNALREKTQAIYNLADVRFSLQQSQIKLMLIMGQIDGIKTSAIHE